MSPKFTRSSLKFEYYKRINTDNTPFKSILYLFKNNDKLIIEDPNKGEAYLTTQYQLKDFIRVDKLQTPWTKNIDGSYLKFEERVVKHIIPIHDFVDFANLQIDIPHAWANINMIRNINERHFKLVKKDNHISINASFPIWNLWGLVTKKKEESNDEFRLNQLYMKIGDMFYRFPYGNVNQSNNVCTGKGPSYFQKIDHIWISFITTIFNTDYGFAFKSYNDDDNIRQRFVRRSETKHTIKVPTFDLDHINMLIQLKKFDKLGSIDGLYFLSNIEDVEDETVINFLYKIPKMPWEEKKE